MGKITQMTLTNGTVVIPTDLEDCYIIEPKVYDDSRGYFQETYSKSALSYVCIDYDFVQGNESFTEKKGTLRGLHFQTDPNAQAKLVRCLDGKIADVVVDLRFDSPTYKQWIKIVLSRENNKQLLVPRGFAHGFITLTDNVRFSYQVDNFYNQGSDSGIIYNDPTLDIDWGFPDKDIILSDKDKKLELFDEKREYFVYKKTKN